MPTKQPPAPANAVVQQKLETLNAFIEEQVIQALGKPGNLLRVQVRPVWDNFYRVNVLVGADAASARVGHSYFLKVNGEGNVIAANPQLLKQY